MTSLLVALACVSSLLTLNALFPQKRRRETIIFSFLAGWLTTELAWHQLVLQLAVALALTKLGAVDALAGKLAWGALLASWAGLLTCASWSSRAGKCMDKALDEALSGRSGMQPSAALAERLRTPIGLSRLLWPFYLTHRDVEHIADIPYADVAGPRNCLDVYRPSKPLPNAPVVLQIHGGGWVVGHKRQQALPLLVDLASRGCVCVSANYRLSPRATFPEHIIDVKRALAWVREHIAQYGGDPSCVIVTGGSAGGHLAALAALTPNEPRWQPGFEQVDTRVQGCIAFYGIYDLATLSEAPPPPGLIGLWQRFVIKQSFADHREAFVQASPLHHVRSDAPPFLIIHGTHDSMAPTAVAREFAATLRGVSAAPVAYAELPGAQHAFDIFHSVRTHHVIRGIHRFVAYVIEQHAAARVSTGIS